MKIQCDACEKAAASVVCFADEAALCAECDIKVHKANKLASKHKRLALVGTSPKLSRCDICQEKAAIVFCLEDRAMLCQDCDESVHSPDTLAAKHQRFLATGIRVVALNAQSSESQGLSEFNKQPTSISNSTAPVHADPRMGSAHSSSAKPIPLGEPCWSVDELLPLSDFESKGDPDGLGYFDWEVDGFDHLGLFEHEQEEALACRVPQLSPTGPAGGKPSFTVKGKSKTEIPTVPDFDGACIVPDSDEACIVPEMGSLDTHEFYPTPPPKRMRRSSFEAW